MKFNQIALAVLAAGAATAASAGVTVTPLIGYNYVQEDAAAEKQRRLFTTGTELNANRNADVTSPDNGGVALKSDLYTGLALGVELTPSTQLQVEYGVTNPSARASEDSYYAADQNRFSAEQENISANFLIGTEQFSGYNPATKFKPYVLVGGGMQKTSIENDTAYETTDGATQTGLTGTAAQKIPAGSVIADAGKDTIANLGLGARYLINDALALRGEVRAEHNLDNSWTQGKALAGLEVTLGGRLAPVVPVAPQVEPVAPVVIDDVVVDSDRDGVPDHLDACAGTLPNTVVDARGCPVQVNLVEELRQELRVFFDYDKSAIKPQYREEVAKVAAQMQEFPNATAVIEGHASRDSARSNARYNQRLSEARANAVKSMLSNEFGIAPNRLNAVGYGFDRPIAPNDTAEGRAMNRRVEAVITGTKTTTVDQTKDMVVQP